MPLRPGRGYARLTRFEKAFRVASVLGCAVAKHSAAGPGENIDGRMALAMAPDRAEQPHVEAPYVRLLGWL
jgi:hypothetical protein